MLDDPGCPLCAANDWEVFSRRTFVKGQRGLSKYVALRYAVLFELWKPGATSVTIHFALCRRCGFVVYMPRPTSEDLDAKYRRLGGSSDAVKMGAPATRVDRRRSSEIVDSVREHLPAGPRSVLDFGGGRGALMVRFVEAGADCAVVDYTSHTIQGVTKACSTLGELPEDRKFSLVIASHVLEHLSDPVGAVAAIRRHLAADGILFVEVPLEILGGAPRIKEPVTHVNFFSEGSVATMLERGGYRCLRCWTTPSLNHNGRYQWAVRAVASPVDAPLPSSFEQRAAATRRLLREGSVARLTRKLSHPRMFLPRILASV